MKQEINTVNKILLNIDTHLHKLVKKIELLTYVNPINIESEKERFFASKYLSEPDFIYPNIDFDKFKLHKELFSLPIEKIEDDRIKSLYQDIIYFYSGLIQSIETIGTGKKFYYNSLHSFGTPTEKDVENAKFILHFDENLEAEHFKPKHSVLQTETFFKDYSKRYDFKYHITHSDRMGAIAMVLNNQQTLVLNSNHMFSDNEIGVLTNHEIGVHMVTTMNALLHPLKIFSHGFPNNVETQEGLSVFSEYMSGNLTIKRLKELAYRVLAVNCLAKGNSFSKTFRMLHSTYDLNKNDAFYITTRVHRGGGFTKDYLYLTGLSKIYSLYKKGTSLDVLLTGKVSIEYKSDIEYLQEKGLAVKPKYITDSFAENNNKNKTIDFILDNLK
ncbi:flavohemoglobin expression-modulating QEGLA motif protein [Pontimicrobium aquaticum]|uniref:DUF1704 domain-containing protein n=1 Tax=Pontimicrobium aquaticum TaxID=2565367 RepID=A0A4U0ENZ7_9FLAO|nr:tyrosine/phenylalanine carboxypeptidase domain-containing protein [Pontimicrobium aquaticum]TJY33336.1 DUF1704 domain-containing protein [Pontimicrobium aquaticum]